MAYNPRVEALQATEYPMLQGKTYLDHGGTTIYAKSVIDRFAADMVSNLYGNPHSASTPAMLSGQIVDDTREKTLRFFGADPEHFDLVFVQNATAAIKLVMESFKDIGHASKKEDRTDGGFWYGYHVDCHNSVVGVRETTDDDHHCFQSDAEVDQWLAGTRIEDMRTGLGLFAYPAQSNFNGRRLPLQWTGQLRNSNHSPHHDIYSMLDAAAYATTAPLNKIFADNATAPDFTVVSFYKIFGFPDLGGLIVRRDSGDILQWGRKYFGGGTVSMVTVLGNKPFHHFKPDLHSSLEDGTLPFHNIFALSLAIDVHRDLYGPDPMSTISQHTAFLGKYLFDAMSSLTHASGLPVCHIYKEESSTYGDPLTQGSTVAFNVITADGSYAPYTTVVETLADERQIFVRSGQLCNPGGVAKNLGWETWRLKRLWADGYRCGDTRMEIVKGRPIGVVRVSLGAMSTRANIDTLISFLREEFVIPSPYKIKNPIRVAPRYNIDLPRDEHHFNLPSKRSKDAPTPTPTNTSGFTLSRAPTLQRRDSLSSMSDKELRTPLFSQKQHNRESFLPPLPGANVFQEYRVMPHRYVNRGVDGLVDVKVHEISLGGNGGGHGGPGKKGMKKFFSKHQLRSFVGGVGV